MLTQSLTDRMRADPEVTATTPCYFTVKASRGPQVGPNAPPPGAARHSVGRDRASEKGKGLGLGLERPAMEEHTPWVSLKDWVDEVRPSISRFTILSLTLRTPQIPITLSQETAMEVVVQMFQRLGLRSVLFTRQGALTGILTKMVRALADLAP